MDNPMKPYQIRRGRRLWWSSEQELGMRQAVNAAQMYSSLDRELKTTGTLAPRIRVGKLRKSGLLKVAITVVLLLPLLLLSLTSSIQAAAETDHNYEYLQALNKHPPDQFWNDLAHEVLESLALPKKFRITWGLKSPGFSRKDISFLLFDSEGVKELAGNPHIRNCKYFSSDATITCDVRLIRWFAETFGIDKELHVVRGPDNRILQQSHTLSTREEQRFFYRGIMKWVIAHEFGHAFYGHNGTFSSLSESDLSDSNKPREVESSPESKDVLNRCHAYERAADKYFVSLLTSDKALSEAYSDLLIIINAAKDSANCPNEPVGYTCEAVRGWDGVGVSLGPGIVTMNMSETHPAMIVRVLDLLDRIAKQRRQPENGFHKQVRDYRKMMLVKFSDESTRRRVCQIKDEETHSGRDKNGSIPRKGDKAPQF